MKHKIEFCFTKLFFVSGWIDLDSGKHLNITPSLSKIFKISGNVGKKIWTNIISKIKNKEGFQCWWCKIRNHKNKLEPNEFWDFYVKDDIFIQKLRNIHLLCKKCHVLYHFDLYYQDPRVLKNLLIYAIENNNSQKLLEKILQKLKIEKELISHFCKLKKCKELDFWDAWGKHTEKEQKLKVMQMGSRRTEIDYGNYTKFLKELFIKTKFNTPVLNLFYPKENSLNLKITKFIEEYLNKTKP